MIAVPRRIQSAPIPLGPSNLWAPMDDQVGVEGPDVEIDVRRALDGVDVDERPPAADPADGRDQVAQRLDRADLVVGELQRDQDGALVERGIERARGRVDRSGRPAGR